MWLAGLGYSDPNLPAQLAVPGSYGTGHRGGGRGEPPGVDFWKPRGCLRVVTAPTPLASPP